MACLVEVKKENSSSPAHWLEYYWIIVSCKRDYETRSLLVKIVVNSFEKKIIIYSRKEEGRREREKRERWEQRLSTVKQKDLPIIGQPIQSIITKTRWHGTIGGLVKYIWKLLLSRFLNSHRTRLCKYSVTQQKAATVPCSFNQETLSLRTPGHSVIHWNRIIKYLKKKTWDGK